MRRIWYKDGTYIDCQAEHALEYENDPDYSRTENAPPSKLPGNYAVMEKLGEYERTITFQTHQEFIAYLESCGTPLLVARKEPP